MAFELVYTSAQQGLQPGSTGFCTVAMTNGMAPSLVRKLEALTGYRPYYEHFDSRSALNPPAFFHYQWMDGRAKYDIVGRVCSCAPDHTGRSNKLAHFLVVNDREKENCPGGPADFAGSSSPFLESWRGAPQLLQMERRLPGVPYAPKAASLWQQYMGDAGWAGYLAECYRVTPEKPVYILYRPDQHRDILGLVSEALNVLPQNLRWKVSYNTCFLNVPADIQCNWRFCIDAPEYMRGILPSAKVIRLGEKRPVPQESSLTAAARSAVRESAPKPPSSLAGGESSLEKMSLGEKLRAQAHGEAKGTPSESTADLKSHLSLKKDAAFPAMSNGMMPSPQYPPVYQNPQNFMQENALRKKVVHLQVAVFVLLGVLALVLLGGGMAFMSLRIKLKNGNEESAQANNATSNATDAAGQTSTTTVEPPGNNNSSDAGGSQSVEAQDETGQGNHGRDPRQGRHPRNPGDGVSLSQAVTTHPDKSKQSVKKPEDPPTGPETPENASGKQPDPEKEEKEEDPFTEVNEDLRDAWAKFEEVEWKKNTLHNEDKLFRKSSKPLFPNDFGGVIVSKCDLPEKEIRTYFQKLFNDMKDKFKDKINEAVRDGQRVSGGDVKVKLEDSFDELWTDQKVDNTPYVPEMVAQVMIEKIDSLKNGDQKETIIKQLEEYYQPSNNGATTKKGLTVRDAMRRLFVKECCEELGNIDEFKKFLDCPKQ